MKRKSHQRRRSARRANHVSDDELETQAEEECRAWDQEVREFIEQQLIEHDEDGRPCVSDEAIERTLDS